MASGHTHEMNATRRESGNHLMPATPVGIRVTRRASPPSGAISQSCGSSSLSRFATKAMRVPSGDQRGSPSFSPASVRGRGSPPKVERSHSFERPLFSSMS